MWYPELYTALGWALFIPTIWKKILLMQSKRHGLCGRQIVWCVQDIIFSSSFSQVSPAGQLIFVSKEKNVAFLFAFYAILFSTLIAIKYHSSRLTISLTNQHHLEFYLIFLEYAMSPKFVASANWLSISYTVSFKIWKNNNNATIDITES